MVESTTLIGVLVIVLDVIAIISVLAGHSSALRKLTWTLVIILLPILGMILYFLLGRTAQDA